MDYGYIYKTTNLLNNRIYIGKHKGEYNPNYFGSGLIIGDKNPMSRVSKKLRGEI
jgi:hypothetical protein